MKIWLKISTGSPSNLEMEFGGGEEFIVICPATRNGIYGRGGRPGGEEREGEGERGRERGREKEGEGEGERGVVQSGSGSNMCAEKKKRRDVRITFGRRVWPGLAPILQFSNSIQPRISVRFMC